MCGVFPKHSLVSALPQASHARDTLQPSVTSGYTPPPGSQTGYGPPSHNIHSMSGPVTGMSLTSKSGTCLGKLADMGYQPWEHAPPGVSGWGMVLCRKQVGPCR